MQPWEAVVTAVLGAGGGAFIVKMFDIFTRRGSDVVKTGLKEHTRRTIKKIELTGDAQKDIVAIAQQMYADQRESQDEINELYGKVASLETANNALRSSFDKMKAERDIALAENRDFVRQISDLLVSSTNLTERLAKRESEYALLAIEHEGAKARIEKYEETIAEMKQFIDEMNAERARLESELERARTRG